MNKDKVIYYSDPLNDDFANNNIKQKELPDNFKYINNNVFYLFFEFIIYRIIVRPLVFLYIKIKFHQKTYNKKLLKEYKDGYFLYGNHTNGDVDAFIPSMFTRPKKDYIIVNPDATSIKGIRTLVMMLGAIPLPNNLNNTKLFIDCINKRVNDNNLVVIYPEAHIWPYYNKIRPFKDNSFAYPYNANKAVFCFVNVYKKRKIGKRPRIETYVEGPFFKDNSLPRKEGIKQLRDKVYDTMVKINNEHADYEYIKYVYKEK